LRCGCCHNPDTWDVCGGMEYTAEEVLRRAKRCRAYFGKDGGVTLSGGEPLLQRDFAAEIFSLCRQENIHTCLDTSGCVDPALCESVLENTDRVLLDIKYTLPDLYEKHVGCDMAKPLSFLAHLNERNIPVTLRQVIIPSLTDNKENILHLKAIAENHPCVDKIELLPFRKICQTKYDAMNITFPFGHLPEPDTESMKLFRKLLDAYGG